MVACAHPVCGLWRQIEVPGSGSKVRACLQGVQALVADVPPEKAFQKHQRVQI